MRLRFAVLASLLTALIAVLPPSAVTAAPRHNHGLTINAVPRQIIAGESVFIYGRLQDSDAAGQTIRLYHHIAPRAGYTLVATTVTDRSGYYEFTRAEGVVLTNRSWFVRGPDHTHSRTVYERVSALVSLEADDTNAYTLHPVTFTGHVYPAHPFERVLVQERTGTGDDWHTIKTGFTGPGSAYRIVYRWRIPGARDVRVTFPGDRRNARGSSDPVTVTVQQTQRPGFTIQSSAPVIDYGGSATISGVLDRPGTTTPDAGVPVTLLGRTAGQHQFVALATTTTGGDGSYSFAPQSPAHGTLYVVAVTLTPKRRSAALFEGVRDLVSATPSSTSSTVGGTVTFTGSVLPGRQGGVVYLQRLGQDGDWHTVAVGMINGASAYSLSWTFGHAGTYVFRTRVLGDRANFSGYSAPMTIQVSPASSPATMPAAS